MPKAKKKPVKSPPIVGKLDDDFIVEKSRPLMLMKEVPFALGELKVLDTYLSRINARDPEAFTVRFSKGEYEDLMGIERMRPERLGKYVDSLMGKIITVPDAESRGGWRKYTLFQACECSQDENEQWWIDLSCTPMAKELFFNLQEIGYIRYQLKNVLPLTSKHSVLLYIYLLDNRFRKQWMVSLQELREKVFRCNTTFYAENFKDFRRQILDVAIKEVNEKTDLTFGYEAIRSGRKVTNIVFTLKKDEVQLPDEVPYPHLPEPEDEQTSLFDDEPELAEEDPWQLSIEALPPELTREEVAALRELALPHMPYEIHTMEDKELWLYHYFRRKVMLMKTQNVKSKFGWLKRAVAEDWE